MAFGVALPDLRDLPSGPKRDLVEALRRLYRGAGMPGLRRIATAVMNGDFTDTVSHEKVAAMLRGTGLPRWSTLEPVVRVLTAWNNPRLDPDEQATQMLTLWQAATDAQTPTVAEPAVAVAARPVVVPTASGPRPDQDLVTVDTADLVGTVGMELAGRLRAERRADAGRGYVDGVQFARDLPSPAYLDDLSRYGFDVAAWIEPLHESWGRMAAKLDPGLGPGHIPDWAAKAARYLGTFADPIGYDEFSFTPSPAYVSGFGNGLRDVHQAIHDNVAGDDPPRPTATDTKVGTQQVSTSWIGGRHPARVEVERAVALAGPVPEAARGIGKAALRDASLALFRDVAAGISDVQLRELAAPGAGEVMFMVERGDGARVLVDALAPDQDAMTAEPVADMAAHWAILFLTNRSDQVRFDLNTARPSAAFVYRAESRFNGESLRDLLVTMLRESRELLAAE